MPRPDSTVILRASTYRRTPWKNGGGETMEIAVAPTGASLDHFDWRISMATVATDGPFSRFSGVDRTLCILDGAGIELRIDEAPLLRLNDASEPFSFSGDAAARSMLIDGTVTDFNVMTRRDRFSHSVQRIRLHAGAVRGLAPEVRAVFCQSGVVSVDAAGGRRQRLEPRDTMLQRAAGGAPRSLLADTAATVCLVTISARSQ